MNYVDVEYLLLRQVQLGGVSRAGLFTLYHLLKEPLGLPSNVPISKLGVYLSKEPLFIKLVKNDIISVNSFLRGQHGSLYLGTGSSVNPPGYRHSRVLDSQKKRHTGECPRISYPAGCKYRPAMPSIFQHTR